MIKTFQGEETILEADNFHLVFNLKKHGIDKIM